MKLQGKTAVASRTPWITLTPLAASLLLALAGPAMATESAQTPQLVGNKPVASGVMIAPAKPEAGGLVTVKWSYTDEDSDKESGSTVEWLIGGKAVAGQSGSEYTLPKDSSGKSLQVRVTPRSAAPAYPAVGDVASSAMVTILKASISIDDFIKPETRSLKWADASRHCESMNARLPLAQELRDLYTKTTSGISSPKNSAMCDIHGWPLDRQCGGSRDWYWTSEDSSGSNKNVAFMHNGTQSYYDANLNSQVACIKR
ncbi:hypothetical protein JFQ93_002727 [Aeromonas sobria]|nr:hypothetical protein [Aeromonas sobria]